MKVTIIKEVKRQLKKVKSYHLNLLLFILLGSAQLSAQPLNNYLQFDGYFWQSISYSPGKLGVQIIFDVNTIT